MFEIAFMVIIANYNNHLKTNIFNLFTSYKINVKTSFILTKNYRNESKKRYLNIFIV